MKSQNSMSGICEDGVSEIRQLLTLGGGENDFGQIIFRYFTS
jgi:hypothetical protein